MPEGVGGALQQIHRALRPGGVLVDIHPEPEPVRVEARIDDRSILLGEAQHGPWIEKVPRARATLAEAVAAGWFIREAQTEFDFVSHFDGVDSLLAYRQEKKSSLVIDESILVRARRTLAAGSGELLLRERVHAERLRRGGD